MNKYAFVAVVASTAATFVILAVSAKVATDKYMALLNMVDRLESRS